MTNDVAYKMLNDVITHTNCNVAVYGEDELDYVGRDLAKIWEAATACDEIEIELLEGQVGVDWALLVHGNEPDETISDCLHGKWIDNWCQVTDFGSKPYVQELSTVGPSDT